MYQTMNVPVTDGSTMFWQVVAFKCFLCTSYFETIPPDRMNHLKPLPLLLSLLHIQQNFIAGVLSLIVFFLGQLLLQNGPSDTFIFVLLFLGCAILKGLERMVDIYVIVCFLERMFFKCVNVKWFLAFVLVVFFAWFVFSMRFLFFMSVLYFIYDFFNDDEILQLKLWYIALSFIISIKDILI